MSIEKFYPKFGNKFRLAIELFDHRNSADPNKDCADGNQLPKELLYARRLTAWVLQLEEAPTETVLLASRCQHICRWKIPRSSYPMTRPGYLAWRTDLKKFHAKLAGELMGEAGYEQETIKKVGDLLLKKHLQQDPEMQLLEDALCLVFLEFQFAGLADRTAEAKMINALKKSWSKMSPRGREFALKIPLAPKERELIGKALGSKGGD